MDTLASFVEYYLPVFIPVFLTVISVLAGVVTKRIELNLNSLLKIHSDLVLALFSFVIWALVAFQQTGRIDLNADASISFIRVVLLLFGNVMLLIAGVIILNVRWEQWSVLWSRVGPRRLENVVNGSFLLVASLAVFAPVFLAKPRPLPAPPQAPSPSTFTIAVPYVDTSLPRQLGPGNWANRMLCELVEVPAQSRHEAIEKAVAQLESFGRLTPTMTVRPPGTVTVLKDRILVGSE